MPNYISRIDFGDGIERKIKSEGGTGLRIGDVNNFAATSASGIQKIVLTWEDPDDLEIGGVVQASWGGTVIVRKVGSVPISTADGIIILDNKVRDQYSVNGYEDTTVDFDTVYYYRAFPYTTDDLFTEGSYVSEEIENVKVYGAEWDGSASTAWTRTDAAANFTDPNPAINNGTGSSPFDNIRPWSGMQIVEDTEAGTLVSIPKFWYKWTRDGAKMKLQISDTAQEGFFVSPAHADRGDGVGERDIVYVGRYHCSSNYKSRSGYTPKVSTTRANFRTNIHNLGSTIWQYDFAMYWTIMMLYLVEYANWNSQNTIGYGCSPSGSRFSMGYTDSMQYHTGTSATSRTTYGCTQYRYIEGLWDNVWDWCDGIYFYRTNVYCIKRPSKFSDTTTSSGILVGTRANSTGYTTAWTNPTESGFEYALYPSASSGSDTTYVCDICNYNAEGIVLNVGGYYSNSQGQGAFYLSGNYAASSSNTSIGSRLMKLPNNT